MKRVVVAAVLSAFASSALTVAVSGLLRTPAPPVPADPSIAELRAALDSTRKELAELRWGTDGSSMDRKLRAAFDRSGEIEVVDPRTLKPINASGKDEVAPPPEIVPAQVEEPAPEPDWKRQEREAAARRPAAQIEKLKEGATWDQNVEVRSRWILLPEAELLAACGKPDEVVVQERGSETWIYRIPTGERDEEGNLDYDDVCVELNRGRVIRVDG